MARQHIINVHTSTNTEAPSGASLNLGEIAVQHTLENPALWIKVGSGETSEVYEKFIGLTEINNLVNDSKILGSGYTYSGLSYVNSSTTIADAYSALTELVLNNEEIIAEDEEIMAAAINEINEQFADIEEVIAENEATTAGAINDLNDRTSTIETTMNGNYIQLTDYEMAEGESEEELTITEEDTVNDAVGKLQKQILDDEEAIAAGLNDLNVRIRNAEGLISGNTGVTTLSGVVANLSAVTYEGFNYFGQELQNLDDSIDIVEDKVDNLSGTVMSISAKTSGVLTINVNGEEQGKYSPSANTEIDLQIIQEVTGEDVLLTGYELASGSTEEELAIVATDTVNEAFGKLQKQNYDNEAVIAGALNDLDERIQALELSGSSEEEIIELSASVVSNESRIDTLELEALSALTAIIADGDDYITATVNGNSALSVTLNSVADDKDDIISASTTGSLVDAKAVKDYVEDFVSSAVNYKGATSSVPANPEKGDLWIVDSAFTIDGQNAEVGDFIIYNSIAWDVIEKNLDGAITGSLTADTLTLGNGLHTVKSLANGTDGQILSMSGSMPTWVDEAQLSSAVTGSGNVITDLILDDHEITMVLGMTAAELADLQELSGMVEDMDFVIAQALNNHEDRIEALENNSGVSQDVLALSASVVNNEERIEALSGSVVDHEERISILESDSGLSEDIEALSAVVITNAEVCSAAFNDLNDRVTYLEVSGSSSSDLEVLSGVVIDNEEVTSAALNDLNDRLTYLEVSGSSSSDLDALSAHVLTTEYIVATAINDLNDDIQGLSAVTSAHVTDNSIHVTGAEKTLWTDGANSGASAWTAVSEIYDVLDEISGSVIDLSDEVVANEKVCAAALTNLNSRVTYLEVSGSSSSDLDALSAATSSHVADNNVHVTSADKTAWENGSSSGASAWTAVNELSGGVLANEYVVALAINDLDDRVNALSANTGGGSEGAVTAVTITGTGNAVTDATFVNKNLTLTKGNVSGLPAVTGADEGKILMVSGGTWQLVSPTQIYTGIQPPSQSLGTDGDIYLQTE